jgi:hypothetical protein
MKSYFLLAIPLLALCSCQHYISTALPVTPINGGTWTFQKDTVKVTWGTTVEKEYINDLGAGSTLTFDSHSELGSATHTAKPDTNFVIYYYLTNSNTALQIVYPSQEIFGQITQSQSYNYTILKVDDHQLILNYTYLFFDPLGTNGEVYGNYYYTR